MAQKKITDLQLIAAVTSGLSFPSDNGIQSYRATASQIKDYILGAGNVPLSALALDIFTGLTYTDAATDDYFPYVDISDSNKTKKGLVGSFKDASYRSVTSTDTATYADETLYLSGSSFTQTLPTAVGKVGKRYKIEHGGTSLTNIYTLATTSGQTIGGIASGSYKLYTVGETVWVESDNANWIVTNHYAKTKPATYNPTISNQGATANISTWWREGRMCNMEGVITGAGAASAAIVTIGMPSGLTVATAPGSAYRRIVGGFQRDQPLEPFYLLANAGDSTIFVSWGAQNGFAGTQGSLYHNAGYNYAWNARVEINEWQP